MNNIVKRILISFFVFFSFIVCTNITAQEPLALPDDPRVKTGKLPNGLTYVLIKNSANPGYANFCMAQKTGFSLEKEGERGMSKMLESLLLMGTRNFADSTILKYLSTLGVYSNDIIFKTNADELRYTIKNIPITRKNTIDSALLIMYNWLSSLNIDEEDVTSEMQYVINDISDDWSNAESRIDYKLLKELYPNSPYVECKNLNDIISFNRFGTKDLRNFYYEWYRPDLQGIIITGDIDLAATETQIKSLFATIPKSMKPLKRDYYLPKPFDGVKVCIVKDKEYNKTTVSVDFLSEPMPIKYRNTNMPYLDEFMKESISKIFIDRLREGVKVKNLPISGIQMNYGSFIGMTNLYTNSISYETVPEAVYSSLSFLSSEIHRMVNEGFTYQEFIASKAIYMKKLEDLYSSREHLSNDVYMERALNNFFYGYSLASIEMKYEMTKILMPEITQDRFNEYASSLFGVKDNVLITCRMPQNKDIRELSKDRLLTAYQDILTRSTITSGLKADIITWPKFSEGITNKGSIVSENEDVTTGAKIYYLSNGATVIYKKNFKTKDTLSFNAIGKGGFSLLNSVGYEEANFINGILNIGGLDEISQPNIERLYSYYNMDVSAHISLNTQELSGYATISNIDKLFHAIYLNFVARRSDQGAFDAYKKEKLFDKLYMNLAPKDVFNDSVTYYNNSNKVYVKPLDIEKIEEIQYYPLLMSTRKLFSNAADFTFIFTGNVDENIFKSYVLKYICKITGDKNNRENWRILPYYRTKGVVNRRFLYNMEIPRTYNNITYSLGAEYSLRNKVLCDLMRKYISNILNTVQLKKMMSGVELSSKLNYYPEDIAIFNINFVSSNENAQVIKEGIFSAIKKLSEGNISDKEYSEIKNAVNEINLSKSKWSGYWLDALSKKYIIGVDFVSDYSETLNVISKKELSEFAFKMINSGNSINVIMEGTTKDVGTENLKNNKFIKDFFSL